MDEGSGKNVCSIDSGDWMSYLEVTISNTGVYITPHLCTTSLCVRGVPICVFLPSSPYAYWESPYAYRDQILTYQQSFLESSVEPDLFEFARQNMVSD